MSEIRSLRIIVFFGRNPGEELTSRDVETKFEFQSGRAHNYLAAAVRRGLLVKFKRDADVMYRAGPKLLEMFAGQETVE